MTTLSELTKQALLRTYYRLRIPLVHTAHALSPLYATQLIMVAGYTGLISHEAAMLSSSLASGIVFMRALPRAFTEYRHQIKVEKALGTYSKAEALSDWPFFPANTYPSTYPFCTGKTNKGLDAIILVSDWVREDENRIETQEAFVVDGLRLQRYIGSQGGFMGYPTKRVYLVNEAKAENLADAIADENISSVALVGHATIGSWHASDRRVTWEDVAKWTQANGHCKNGFGFKQGCNVRYNTYDNRYHVLSPAFSHPSRHEGALFLDRGKPSEIGLAGSRVTHDLGPDTVIVKL